MPHLLGILVRRGAKPAALYLYPLESAGMLEAVLVKSPRGARSGTHRSAQSRWWRQVIDGADRAGVRLRQRILKPALRRNPKRVAALRFCRA